MSKIERENWITNIENSAAVISPVLGSAAVDSVLSRYGVHDVYRLRTKDLPDVFSELYAIEADLD